jgi:asparagine synthase (glutamine-hydrolysing)
MSGICGIVDLRGAPIDRGQLERMASRIAFRGPEGCTTWLEGGAGFGHARFDTSGAFRDIAPVGLGDRASITADARIDDRAQLVGKLESLGRRVQADCADAGLILHAYLAWGEDCLRHLHGDFAFAIWDARLKRVFCARDRFGVKPFFHAIAGGTFVFSNTFSCVRGHEGVSRELDESTIADYILFELSRDPAATGFAAIRRLAPAHCLVAGPGGVSVRAYWKLPRELEVVHRRDRREYAQGLVEVLGKAVSDRVRGGRVAVLMSGGLDSPALAALATQVVPRGEVAAFTIAFERMFADEERHFAGLVARHLGISWQCIRADDYRLFQDYDRLRTAYAEPVLEPFAALDADVAREASRHARVALTGWDGDTLLNESPRPYLRSLLRDGRFARWTAIVAHYVARERRIVPRSFWRRLIAWRQAAAGSRSVPAWVSRDFELRYGLAERLRMAASCREAPHPVRPYAFAMLERLMSMSRFFEYADPGVTRAPIEYRHPFLDLRVVEYCLCLPPYPWCSGKHVLREAMATLLPAPVLLRPKTPLAGYPHEEGMKRGDVSMPLRVTAGSSIARYVNGDRMPTGSEIAAPDESWIALRPLGLELWLRAAAP